MNDQDQAAFIIAQAICAQAEILGMQAENLQRQARGDALAYTIDDFTAVIDRYGIGHNAVITFLENP